MTDISSVSNPKIKTLKQLIGQSSTRKKNKMFVVETPRFIHTVMEKAPELIEMIYKEPDCDFPELNLENFSDKIVTVSPSILNQCTTLRKSSGLIAVFKMPEWDFETVLPTLSNVCICDTVQTPSNIGAIVRNAVAFNIDAIFLTEGCADPFHPESIRAMAGNCVQVPLFYLDQERFRHIVDKSFHVYDCDPHSEISINQVSFHNKSAFLLGSEGQGVITPYLKSFEAKKRICIPTSLEVESLNVAVSSGIVFSALFERSFSNNS